MTILCTRLDGIMFDVLDHCGNSLHPYEMWLNDLKKGEPLWATASALVKDSIPVGWLPIYSENHFINNYGPGALHERVYPEYKESCSLQLAGTPITGFSDGATGNLLSGSAAKGMSRDDLIRLLERPLIMDAIAALKFQECGLLESIGIEKITEFRNGTYEVFTDDLINGFARRFVRAATLTCVPSYAFQLSANSLSLSTLTNFIGNELGSALSLNERPGKAPVAVIGYMPWCHVLSSQRIGQLRHLSSRMLGQHMPIELQSNRGVAIWYRTNPKGGEKPAVLFNPGFDAVNVSLSGAKIEGLSIKTAGSEIIDNQQIRLPSWSVAVARVS